jgi:hypothetical protein
MRFGALRSQIAGANQERKRQTSLKGFVFGDSDLIVFA